MLTEDFEELARTAPETARLEFVSGKPEVKLFPDGTRGTVIMWLLRQCLQQRPELALYLNRMSAEQRDLVAEAVSVHKGLTAQIADSLPYWPLGLTGPAGPWVAQGLRSPEPAGDSYLTLWQRPGAPAECQVPLAHLRGFPVAAETIFPVRAPRWDLDWDAERGVLRVTTPTTGRAAARVLRLRPLRDD